MPLNKKQIQRLVKFVALLKKNSFPNAKSFAEELLKADLYENKNLACGEKTIHRDIKDLKEIWNAPIEYDSSRNGYYLKHHGWNLEVPVLQDEYLMASVLGAKIASDIVPEPLKSEINDAVDQQLTVNNPDFLDTAFIDSLIAASGVKVQIDPEIFKTLFDAWIEHLAVDITHTDKDGNSTERCIEVHVLTYYNNAWYIKAYCLLKNDYRVFGLHRIEKAKITDKSFEPDQLVIQQVKDGYLFDFKTIKDIEVWCGKDIAGYVKEQHRHLGETYEENEDGSLTVYIPSATKYEIMRWVLAEGGSAKVLKPKSLAAEIVKAAEKVACVNR